VRINGENTVRLNARSAYMQVSLWSQGRAYKRSQLYSQSNQTNQTRIIFQYNAKYQFKCFMQQMMMALPNKHYSGR